ncbi:unnamed protein product, partial [Rotaria sp. Silwood2]
MQLQPANKYIAVQCFLTKTAAMWLRFNKSNIVNWKKDRENDQLDLITDNQINSSEDLSNKCLIEHEQGSDSPLLVTINDLDLKIPTQYSVQVNAEDVSQVSCGIMENLTPDDSLIITVTPPDTQYLFSGQYRPPQCHVFNKVYTGLAFKDIHLRFSTLDLLIDKTTTSAYILTFCGDNKDFSILTYHAEPPYEDIAFKIISKECDYRDKHGFR